jgi:hypothetical protein
MHLNSEIAMELADGRMNRSDNHYWDKHLESCSACAAKLQVWSSLITSVARAHLVSAPDDILTSGKKVFQPAKAAEFRPSLRQIVASLVFDSFAQPATAAVRGQAATYLQQSVMRQIVFQAEEYDIYVRLAMFEDHRDLLGQILPRDSRTFITEANLYLRHDDERIASAAVNGLGEFQFSDVPDGKLSLQIDLPTMTIISALHVTV